MTGVGIVFASLGLAVLAAAAAGPSPAGDLKPGDPAPAFTLPGSDGKTYTPGRVQGQAAGGARLVPEGVHRGLNGRVQVAP